MNMHIPLLKDVYFQHKVLTCIYGKPIFDLLKTVIDELKANACSVPATLSGGLYGHLDLLLLTTWYATLLATPFVKPGNLCPFDPPCEGTASQINAVNEVWQKTNFTFNLCQATKKALIAQVTNAVNATYLAALCNINMSCYGKSIQTLVQHLFATYGKITPQ